MLELLGRAAGAAQADAQTVMASRPPSPRPRSTRVERRDPYKLYHPMTRAGARRRSRPPFDWDAYLDATRARRPRRRSTSPSRSSSRQLDARSARRRLADLQDLPALAPASTPPPVPVAALRGGELRFLRHATCSGAKEMPPRWKRCVQLDRPRPRRGAGPGLRRRRPSRRRRRPRTLEMVTQIEQAHGEATSRPSTG